MANGGIIGPVNVTSRGKNKVTSVTSNSPSAVTTQPGTRIIDYAVVAGGGSGGNNVGGGGGAGGVGYRQNVSVSGATALGAVVIGGGATAPTSPTAPAPPPPPEYKEPGGLAEQELPPAKPKPLLPEMPG